MPDFTNAKPAVDLAPDYYLGNFRFLLDWVWARYEDLLNEDEREFVQRFYRLGRDAQCLLVRLSGRKGPLFRRDKLEYQEITDLDAAADELIHAGLLHCDIAISLDDFTNALTKIELLALFSEPLGGMKQARKEMLVQQLATSFTENQSWNQWTAGRLGNAFYLDNQAVINNLLLLFFGNAYQNLTEFVLQDLGLYRYENYSVDHQHRLFKHRAELEQYWHLLQLRDQLEECWQTDDPVSALICLAEQLPPSAASEKLQRRRAKLANQLAYELERAGEFTFAARIYEQSHLSPARERRIRLLEKQGDYEAAWELLCELLAAPLDEQELQVAQRIAPRLAKKLARESIKKPVSNILEQQIELAPLTDDAGHALRVEEVVRLSIDGEQTPCVYAENALLSGLFGLWLWPEMFRGIDGAFANPFQMAPLDIHQENFVRNRPGIADLWALIDNDNHRTHITDIWKEKFGTANYFVNWSFLSRDLLDIALRCIPSAHLKIIFERLLFDIRSNRSGLPDLIQFFPEEKRYRMIEVKGPGDRIQDNQRRWLDYFAQHQIPAEVWYVRWC